MVAELHFSFFSNIMPTLRSYALLGFSQIVTVAARYWMSITVAKSLGFEELGFFGLHIGLLTMAVTLSGFGYGFVIQKQMVEIKDKSTFSISYCKQFFFQLSLLLFFGPLVALGSSLTIFGFSNWNVIFVTIGISSLFVISDFLFSQITLALRSSLNLLSFSIISAIQSALLVLLLLLVVNHGLGSFLDIIFAISLSYFLPSIVFLFVFLTRFVDFSIVFPNWRDLARDIRAGIPLLMAYLSEFLLATGDRIAVGWIINFETAGNYILAAQISGIVLLMVKFLNLISIPLLKKLFISQGFEALKMCLRIVVLGIVAFALIWGTLFYFFLPEIWFFIFDQVLEDNIELVVYVLLIGFCFQSFYLIFNSALFVLGEASKASVLLVAAVTIANIFFNCLGLLFFGMPVLVAIFTTLSFILLFGLSYKNLCMFNRY